MTLTEMVQEAHRNAEEKGWWPEDEVPNLPEKLALIHSEVSEALEDYRSNSMGTVLEMTGPNRDIGKPVGFSSELADVVIRVGDLCGYLGIDLEAVVKAKMAFNRTRPFRHGGKRA